MVGWDGRLITGITRRRWKKTPNAQDGVPLKRDVSHALDLLDTVAVGLGRLVVGRVVLGLGHYSYRTEARPNNSNKYSKLLTPNVV